MFLIPCTYDCIYQNDGYCSLQMPTVITNKTGKGCVHYVQVANNTTEHEPIKKDPNSQEPQMLL